MKQMSAYFKEKTLFLVKILQPLHKFKKLSFFLIFVTIISGVITTYSAKIMSDFVHAIETKDVNGAWFFFWSYGILIAITYIVDYFSKIISGYFDSGVGTYMDCDYMKKYLLLDNNYTEKVGTGKINNIVRRGIDARLSILTTILTDGISGVVTVISAFVLIGMYNPGWVNLVILGIFILFAKIWFDGYKRLGYFREQRRDIYQKQDKSFIKVFMSKFEILQDQKSKKEVNHYKTYLHTLKKSYYQGANQEFLHIDTTNILIDIARMTLLFFCGWGVMGDTIDISLLILYTYLLNMVISALSSINSLTSSITEDFVFVENLRDTFDTTKKIEHYSSGQNFIYKTGVIQIKNIQYSTDRHNVVFRDFSLDIQGGKITALVGTSGSGKSTLAKLIAGYIYPDRGEILIDDQDVNKIKLSSYYDNIGYLTQDPSVFDGTILENLTYASRDKVDQKTIENAINEAECEFVYDLPKGIHTQIGERGVMLSGGQKQRLAIAKILIKNPNIIVLDEPTSSLDSLSEHNITEIFYRVFKGKTIIVIAHRLQTVVDADDIIVIERPFGGKKPAYIAQRGNNQALLCDKKGLYCYMHKLQSTGD